MRRKISRKVANRRESAKEAHLFGAQRLFHVRAGACGAEKVHFFLFASSHFFAYSRETLSSNSTTR
jgi:hypothetical protein